MGFRSREWKELNYLEKNRISVIWKFLKATGRDGVWRRCGKGKK